MASSRDERHDSSPVDPSRGDSALALESSAAFERNAWRRGHLAETTCFLLQPTSVLAAKPPAPLADRLIGDDDASLGQQIFDLPEPVFPPDPQPSGVRKHHAQPPWWTARNSSRSEPGVSITRSKATSRIVGASGRASGRSKSGNRIPPLLPAPRLSVYPVEPVIEDRRTATGAHG